MGIGNEGLEDLCQIEFKELKELYLGGNNISDIKVLENDYKKRPDIDKVYKYIKDEIILKNNENDNSIKYNNGYKKLDKKNINRKDM